MKKNPLRSYCWQAKDVIPVETNTRFCFINLQYIKSEVKSNLDLPQIALRIPHQRNSYLQLSLQNLISR